MSITAPPRPPRPSGPIDRDELEALVEALIEEARRRARRRRRRNGACVLLTALAVGGLYFGLDRVGGGPTGATGVATASAGDGAATARDAAGRWALPHGPDGGPGNTVAVAPSAPETVYLGTARGVFRSKNGGRSWTRAGLVPPASADGSTVPGVTTLLVDGRTPNTVYAGLNSEWDGGKWNGGAAYRHAVYKTTDGGRTWRALGLIGQPVAISPTGPQTVYAAAGARGGESRLLRSTNGGRTWQPADSGLPPTYLDALAFDPRAPGTVYAAMGQRGIFASSDGGGKWRALRVAVAHRNVTAIAVDPRRPQTIYAGTDNGVIKSLDGGREWRMANAALGAHNRDRDYMQVTALLVDKRDSRTVYATTDCTGVFKSTDGGTRWAPANAGLDPQCGWSYALALDSSAPRTLYAAGRVRGVLKSLDGGATWRAANNGLSLTAISSLAVDPQSPRTVYAATRQLGLFKSSDTGAHWRPLATGHEIVSGVALDPSDPRNVLLAAPGGGVALSVDAGRTWKGATASAPGLGRVNVVAIGGATAYAGTEGNGLFGSTDGGRTWRPLGPPGPVHVQTLAISPADPTVVYAGVYGSQARGLYESTDSGGTWQRLTDALDIDVSAIALDPANLATIYAAGGSGGVLKTIDGGTTWSAASSGLPQQRVKDRTRPGMWITYTLPVAALAIDPVHPGTLYAAAGWRGVFTSTDSGERWRPLNVGLTDQDVTALALDATGRRLYAGTNGRGVATLRVRGQG
jgi:photosystem II stability/assembly factor-like uncharacterized protein